VPRPKDACELRHGSRVKRTHRVESWPLCAVLRETHPHDARSRLQRRGIVDPKGTSLQVTSGDKGGPGCLPLTESLQHLCVLNALRDGGHLVYPHSKGPVRAVVGAWRLRSPQCERCQLRRPAWAAVELSNCELRAVLRKREHVRHTERYAGHPHDVLVRAQAAHCAHLDLGVAKLTWPPEAAPEGKGLRQR